MSLAAQAFTEVDADARQATAGWPVELRGGWDLIAVRPNAQPSAEVRETVAVEVDGEQAMEALAIRPKHAAFEPLCQTFGRVPPVSTGTASPEAVACFVPDANGETDLRREWRRACTPRSMWLARR